MKKRCLPADISVRYLTIMLSFILIFTVSCAPAENGKQGLGEQDTGSENGSQALNAEEWKGQTFNGEKSEGQSLSGEESQGQSEDTMVMGRYREEKIALPMSVRTLYDIESEEDGSVNILFESAPGSFQFYSSSDGGVSWESHEIGMEWLPEDYRIVSACFGTDGKIALSAGKMSENIMEDKHAVGEYVYFLIEDASGSPLVRELQLQLPEPKEENLQSGYGLQQIMIADDGKIYGMFSANDGEDIDFQVFCFNSAQGEVLWKLKTSAAEIDLYEDKIYLNEHSGAIQILDTENGDKLGELSVPLGNGFMSCMDINVMKEKVFYCNEQGIYGTDYNAALTELLVDGNLSSFSDVNSSIKGFCSLSEEEFLVFVQNAFGGDMELLRYVYDEELPAQPEHELVVYSLEENDVMDKIIFDFQSSHPEVLVEYEVGMAESTAKEEADAISNLNTEIMAGNGPDILLLNGLPWESYGEKGILADLRGDLDTYISGEKGFANLFQAYQTGGAQSAAPICFKVPVLIGTKDDISSVDSPQELLETVERIEDLPPFFRAGQRLLCYLFSIYWQNIETENGSVSREELKKLLENIKKINDNLQEKENEISKFFNTEEEESKSFGAFANDELLDVSNIKYGNAAMDLGYLSAVHDFVDICNQDLSYQAVSEGVFSALIAGINSETQNMEIAREFLDFALSEEEQKIFIDDGLYPNIMGLPVNRAVFAGLMDNPAKELMEEYGRGYAYHGEVFEWPNKQAFAKLEEVIETCKIPAMEDNIVIDMVRKEAVPYLSGEENLETAAAEIAQSLELYLLEK